MVMTVTTLSVYTNFWLLCNGAEVPDRVSHTSHIADLITGLSSTKLHAMEKMFLCKLLTSKMQGSYARLEG